MSGLSSTGRGVVVVFLLASLLAMFITSFISIKGKIEGRLQQSSQPTAARDAAGARPGSPDAGLSPEQSEAVVGLMQELQANPNNADALTGLAEIFMSAQEWGRAEVFLERAILSRPGDTRPRYMLGIARFKQNRPADAAKSFEELLQLKEDPAAMYNLAILYKHHLGRPEEALPLLQKALASPQTDEALAARIKDEL